MSQTYLLVRSDKYIVDQTIALAKDIARLDGFDIYENVTYLRDSENPRCRKYWEMARLAQLELTNTDPNDADDTLKEEERRRFDLARADRLLTAEDLREKYDGNVSRGEHGGEHPRHQRCDWRQAVVDDTTLLGYWEWVKHMCEEEV